MKNYIRKFVRLNTKTSEEDRYVKKKKDVLSLPEGFQWKRGINMIAKTKIRPFMDTMNFAITNSEKTDTVFLKNFDDSMQKSIYYIKNLIKREYPDMDLTVDDVNRIVMEDYSQIIDNTFQNDSIYDLSMRYIATKYLAFNRDILSQMLEEVESMDYKKFMRDERYSDDFKKNCMLTACALKQDYEQSSKEFYDVNFEEYDKIQKLVQERGRDNAFLAICNEYNGKRNNDYIQIRLFLKSVYWIIYGIEGREKEKDNKSKSPVSKMMEKYAVEDYIDLENYIIRDCLKNELIDSIILMVYQLDSFGQIFQNMALHNSIMVRLKLPGLIFKVSPEQLPEDCKIADVMEYYNSKATGYRILMSKESLKNLDIESLLQLNSFYNNRLAKVLENYGKDLFIIEDIGGIEKILSNFDKDELDMGLKREDIGDDTLNAILEKYQVLLLQVKQSYAEIEKERANKIERNNKDVIVKTTFVDKDENNEREQVIYSQRAFIDTLKKCWRNEYEDYFEKKLPKTSHSLKMDFSFVSRLYNPVHLIYKFKNHSIKSEYAYWYLAMKENLKKNMNFGIVLNGEEKRKQILLASDPSKPQNIKEGSTVKLNFPNRLHCARISFVDFWKSYTGSPLIRVYEGYDDFIVDEEYIATQVLCPTDSFHIRYLKDLRKKQGKKYTINSLKSNKSKKKNGSQTMMEKCGDTVSTTTIYTEPMVRHIEGFYGLGEEVKRKVRFYNLDTDEVFVLMPSGELKQQSAVDLINNRDGRI